MRNLFASKAVGAVGAAFGILAFMASPAAANPTDGEFIDGTITIDDTDMPNPVVVDVGGATFDPCTDVDATDDPIPTVARLALAGGGPYTTEVTAISGRSYFEVDLSPAGPPADLRTYELELTLRPPTILHPTDQTGTITADGSTMDPNDYIVDQDVEIQATITRVDAPCDPFVPASTCIVFLDLRLEGTYQDDGVAPNLPTLGGVADVSDIGVADTGACVAPLSVLDNAVVDVDSLQIQFPA